MARQRKVEIQEYDVGAERCDTSSLGFMSRTVQENTGYTLNMAVMGSLELHQAIVHHGTPNEVVVVGILNSEMCDENIRSDATTARIHSGNATDVLACTFQYCSVSATIQKFPTAPSHTLKSECVGQHVFGDEKGQYRDSPQSPLRCSCRRA